MIQDVSKVVIVEVGIFRFLYNSLFFCTFKKIFHSKRVLSGEGQMLGKKRKEIFFKLWTFLYRP